MKNIIIFNDINLISNNLFISRAYYSFKELRNKKIRTFKQIFLDRVIKAR